MFETDWNGAILLKS